MSNWVSSLLNKHIIPAIEPKINNCKARLAKIGETFGLIRKGTLFKNAKELGMNSTTKWVGMQIGAAYPETVIITGVALGTWDLAYKNLSKSSSSDPYDDFVKSATISTLTSLAVVHCVSSGYFHELDPTATQYLLSFTGTLVGGWVSSWMTSGPSLRPWYDGNFSRNARSQVTQELALSAANQVPLAWPITTALQRTPLPLRIAMTPLTVAVDAIPMMTLYVVAPRAASYGACYAFPLIQAYRSEKKFPDYINYDPNLVVKMITEELFGNPQLLAKSLTKNMTTSSEINHLFADCLAKGIEKDQIVNILVRSLNHYFVLLQDPMIQTAMKNFSMALAENDPKKIQATKNLLRDSLYRKIFYQGEEASAAIAFSVIQTTAQKVSQEIKKQEIHLLGVPVSSSTINQQYLEVHFAAFAQIALLCGSITVQEPYTTTLSQTEIHQFYQNLNRMMWAPYHPTFAKTCENLIGLALPHLLNQGYPIFHMIFNELIPHFGEVDEEGNLFFDAVDDGGEVCNQPTNSIQLFNPSYLLKTAAEMKYGNSSLIATNVAKKIPVWTTIQTFMEKVIHQGIQKELVMNLSVRAFNLYSSWLSSDEIQSALKGYPSAQDKKAALEHLNHLIWPRFRATTTVNTFTNLISQTAQQIKTQIEPHIQGLKICDQPLLEFHLRNLSMAAAFVMTTQGVKNDPLSDAEVQQFYLNFINLIQSSETSPIIEIIRDTTSHFVGPVETSTPKPSLLKYIKEKFENGIVKAKSIFKQFKYS